MEQWGRDLIGRTVESLSRYRYIWLAFIIVIPAVSYVITGRLTFDQNIESLFAEDDERLLTFQRTKTRFGGDEFAVVAWTTSGLFDSEGELTDEARDDILKFSNELNAIPGVQPESTQNLPAALKFAITARYKQYFKKLLENSLIGEDNKTTAVVLRLKPERTTTEPRSKTIDAVRDAAQAHSPRAWVVGEPIQVHDMFRIVQQDGSMLFLVSLALLSAVIFLLFRNVRWVTLPVLAVVATIVCTEALLVLSQLRLSMVSSMLNSMVTIIVIATCTHVTVHYRGKRSRGSDPDEAMKQTLSELAAPVFWTCATTGVGFLALLSSHITPVRSFGLMMGLAAAVSFGVFALLLPGGMLIGGARSIPRTAPAEAFLSKLLLKISSAIQSRPVLLGILGLLLMLAALPGFAKLRLETDFSKNFRESSEIVQSLQFVETKLGGAGIWEVNFPAPPVEELDKAVGIRPIDGPHSLAEADPDADPPTFLEIVKDFTSELREMRDENGAAALNVSSLTDGLRAAPRFLGLQRRLNFLSRFQPEFVPSFYDAESGRMRIVLRSREQQRSEQKLKLIRQVEELTRKRIPDLVADSSEPPAATGMFVLLTFVIQSLLTDQIVSFLWAACGISLMMTIAFRSPLLGLLSLVPNVFPIVLVIGFMGWTGTPVNIGTAMIASVSMGLTVDSTIHYISGFRRTLEHGSVDEAIAATHQSVGRALVFAHVALIAGFLVLTLSDFVPLVYFGVLLSLSMLGGLIGDLVMLPVLLRWVYRKHNNVQPASQRRSSFASPPGRPEAEP